MKVKSIINKTYCCYSRYHEEVLASPHCVRSHTLRQVGSIRGSPAGRSSHQTEHQIPPSLGISSSFNFSCCFLWKEEINQWIQYLLETNNGLVLVNQSLFIQLAALCIVLATWKCVTNELIQLMSGLVNSYKTDIEKEGTCYIWLNKCYRKVNA